MYLDRYLFEKPLWSKAFTTGSYKEIVWKSRKEVRYEEIVWEEGNVGKKRRKERREGRKGKEGVLGNRRQRIVGNELTEVNYNL